LRDLDRKREALHNIGEACNQPAVEAAVIDDASWTSIRKLDC